MKYEARLICFSAMALVWTGCVVRQGPTVTQELSTEALVTPSLTAVSPPSLTSPSINIESTVSPSSTERIATPAVPLCAKNGIQTHASDDFGIQGTIVYRKGRYGLYTVGGDPLVYSKLPVGEEQKYSTFGFSPDGNWFAYSPLEYDSTGELNFESPKIILLSADGKRIEQRLSVEQFSDELQVAHQFMGFSGYSYWINNDTIYAALYSMNPDPKTTRHINDLPKILEPFKNIWREDLLRDLPEYASPFAKGISPDMTRMLYMDRDGLFLRDLETGIDIWHDEDLYAGHGALMFWSRDSQTVAYSNLLEPSEYRVVVLISRNGKAKPIMGLSATMPGLYLEDLRWSPDGRYIAILAWEGNEIGDLVYLYDFKKEKFISRCPIGKSTDTTPQLLWSPNNEYLSYVALDYPLTIMDIKTGEIIQLADEGRAAGWSDVFPVIWPP